MDKAQTTGSPEGEIGDASSHSSAPSLRLLVFFKVGLPVLSGVSIYMPDK